MNYMKKSTVLPKNPRENANLLTIICHCFTLPLLIKGYKKDIEQTDLYRELNEHRASSLGAKLCKAWNEELQRKSKTHKKPSLLIATLKVFGWRIIGFGILLAMLEFLLRNCPSFFFGSIISNHYSTDDISEAYIQAAVLIFINIIIVFFAHTFFLETGHMGMKIRIAMSSMIYRKVLRLSTTALAQTTSGQIVNLLTNDVGRLDMSVMFVHFIWLGPIITLLTTILIYREIGISALGGIALIALFIPIQIALGRITSTLRLKSAKLTDTRVRMMTEILQGIQVIKMYVWEKPFGKLLQFARQKELHTIRKISYLRCVSYSSYMFLIRLAIMISLTIYAGLGHIITAEKAFVVTIYINLLKPVILVHFAQEIDQLTQTLVAIKRIEDFMQCSETEIYRNDGPTVEEDSNNVAKSSEEISKELPEFKIDIRHIKAKWNQLSNEYCLDDVSLQVELGKLVAIIGPVGSGKSSLIQVILGELPIEKGQIKVNGSISYASQEPWLFTGTVRQNILFGQSLDAKRYNEVIQNCALERDFELLPFGDNTIVGERGVSLSGGQKARISLARAIYKKSSIYLLDDPLSAVDAQVAHHIFDKCLRNNYLRRNIVILATHQRQFLQQVDEILILDHGKMIAYGSYTTIRNSNSSSDFAKLMTDYGNQNKTSDKVEESALSNDDINTKIAVMQTYESKKQGSVGLSLYNKYFRSGGGISFVIIACIITQILASGFDWWLKIWVNKGSKQSNEDILIISLICVLLIAMAFTRSVMVFNVAIKASQNLHNSMYDGIIRATMHFFNVNSSGRILNRFSKDMGQIDERLPYVVLDVVQILLQLFGVIVVILLMNPYFIVPTVISIILFYYIFRFYVKTSRNVKRIEAVTRSPVYSHLTASINGLSTIRAFGIENILIHEFDKHQDLHSSAFYMFMAMSRAFGFWLDCILLVFLTLVTLSFFIFGTDNGANVGLGITQSIALLGMVQWGMRQSAELESIMTSVERVVEYDSIIPERELETPKDVKISKNWPENGKIKFDNLSLRYFPDPNYGLALKSLSFVINPNEKIGIVGRTGAGKSSIISALFRLAYTDGSIFIDDVDIKTLGLYDLRSKISIIPQEPVLFSGTIRFNLDPFGEYSDNEIWEALEDVKLKETATDLEKGLQSEVLEGGTNFSVGQRQLFCLARAILRKNKILVMDEATANVDIQTDSLIQITIRKTFENCTVLTIAHRLNTVIDSDKILVMGSGTSIEYGTPYELLMKEEGPFHDMAMQLGSETFDDFINIAKKSSISNQ